MKNKIIKLLLILICLLTLFGCKKKPIDTEDAIEESKESRVLMIINSTDAVINHLYVLAGEGFDIADDSVYNKNIENLDKPSYKLIIDPLYDEFTEFSVILEDNLGIKYTKTITDVGITGLYQIKLTTDDRVEESYTTWKKIEEWINKHK